MAPPSSFSLIFFNTRGSTRRYLALPLSRQASTLGKVHPYSSEEDNNFAILAQIIIFFSLVSSIALATASPTGAVARGLDIGLTLLFFTPILIEVWVDTGCSTASIKEKLSRFMKKLALTKKGNTIDNVIDSVTV